MAQALRWSDLTTLVAPAGTITFNAATGDTYFVDPKQCKGLGMGEIRAPVDDKGQASGFIVHDFFEKGAVLVIAGVIHARTDTTGDGGADTLMANMVTRLRSILAANGTLNFGSGAAFTVRCNLQPDFPAIEGDKKGFIFGLVSASTPPT